MACFLDLFSNNFQLVLFGWTHTSLCGVQRKMGFKTKKDTYFGDTFAGTLDLGYYWFSFRWLQNGFARHKVVLHCLLIKMFTLIRFDFWTLKLWPDPDNLLTDDNSIHCHAFNSLHSLLHFCKHRHVLLEC